LVAAALLALVLIAGVPRLPPAVSGQPAPSPSPTATPAPAPPPLPPVIGRNAFGVLRDPAFSALPGATVRFGTYSGGLYRMEMPANWNGGLVM
jgi:hypothetical protein